MIKFDGDHYDHEIDCERLTGQMLDVLNCIIKKNSAGSLWWTVKEIEQETGHPQPSISAQIRNLRKPRFGGFHIEGRYKADNRRIFEYKLSFGVCGL